MNRRQSTILIGWFLAVFLFGMGEARAEQPRPNILFAIADDWGWPHASAYGDPVCKTPTFDRLAKEGVLFQHAFVSSPSCTPSRGAILTGQWHWRLEGAANLWSIFPDHLTTYEDSLRENGYRTGRTGKAWGPGKAETPSRALAGPNFRDFRAFLQQGKQDEPFCFWLGTSDPHRPYQLGSGRAAGLKIDDVPVPGFFPDVEEVRSDIADYYYEVQRFDSLVGDALAALEERGELENTIVVMTGDHGMPFPRCKSNLYDWGSRVPLAIRWGRKVPADRVVTDFVSLTDLAPTFLEVAGVAIPESMTGRSLIPLLTSTREGRVDPSWNSILFGKERHVPSQEAPDLGGYPSRALRTDEYLLIVNFEPRRWPNGTPEYERAAIPGTWYGDTDNGPTKTYIIENRNRDSRHEQAYELCFAKRPKFELYNLKQDPDQLRNVAELPVYADVRQALTEDLFARLRATEDPRVVDSPIDFDAYEYLGGGPKHPSIERKKNPRP